MRARHRPQRKRRAACAPLGVIRHSQHDQRSPGNDVLHLLQELAITGYSQGGHVATWPWLPTAPCRLRAKLSPPARPSPGLAPWRYLVMPFFMATSILTAPCLYRCRSTAPQPASPLRMALKKKDLRNWQPRSPVLAYVGNSDPTVFSTSTSSSCKVSGRHHRLLRCRPVC